MFKLSGGRSEGSKGGVNPCYLLSLFSFFFSPRTAPLARQPENNEITLEGSELKPIDRGGSPTRIVNY